MKLHLITVIGLEFDLAYLQHHIEFYQDQVDDAHYILQLPEENPKLIEKAEAILANAKCPVVTSQLLGIFSDPKKIEAINNVVMLHPKEDWVISPDIDEFHIFENQTYKEVIEKHGEERDTFFGEFIDRITEDGDPKRLTSTPSIWEQYPVHATRTADINAVTKRVSLMSVKQRLFNPHRTMSCNYNEYDGPLCDIHHFKWTQSTKAKLERRVHDFQKLNASWWTESADALKRFYS